MHNAIVIMCGVSVHNLHKLGSLSRSNLYVDGIDHYHYETQTTHDFRATGAPLFILFTALTSYTNPFTIILINFDIH